MNLRTGDRVAITGAKTGTQGIIVDFKWNMVLIRFKDKSLEWFEAKQVSKIE